MVLRGWTARAAWLCLLPYLLSPAEAGPNETAPSISPGDTHDETAAANKSSSLLPGVKHEPRDQLAAEVEAILKAWERSASRNRRLDCNFKRTRYDKTFGLELWGEGKLAVDSAGRGFYTVVPSAIRQGQASLRQDAPERWHWTGTRTIQIDEPAGQMVVIEFGSGPPKHADRPAPPALPEQPASDSKVSDQIISAVFAWRNLSHELFREFFVFPRCFVLGAPVEEFHRRFKISVLKVKGTPSQIGLKFKPRLPADQSRFAEVRLILLKDGYEPVALKMVEPDGNEVVYSFSEVRINRDDAEAPDLANPDLRGYRRDLNQNE